MSKCTKNTCELLKTNQCCKGCYLYHCCLITHCKNEATTVEDVRDTCEAYKED